MNLLTFSDVQNSELPALLNLCPTDPRFARKINRTLEWLLNCGSWEGTIKNVQLCVTSGCFVAPPFVANVESVHGCGEAVRIENNWYRMLPGFHPHRWETQGLWFEYRDQVPCFEPLCFHRILRVFVSSSTDRGKQIKFLGYDKNRQWVRTTQAGLMQDGEVVIFDTPFVDTVTEWSSVVAVLKDVTDSQVTVFAKDVDEDPLEPFGTYQHWETKPSYQRYRIHNHDKLGDSCCRQRDVVEANVKMGFIPVSQPDDFLPIGNRVALEMAVMGVKALDDGDLARSDLLLFGDKGNQRLGAIPLLNQEIRTNTGDRFAANVRVGGPCGFRTIMRGFI